MTRYRITYSLKDETGFVEASVVDRDECSAKKLLRVMLKDEGKKLDGIADIRVEAENLPATKQQEREALEEIKAIVDSLGEQSYLRTAFDGCFEDAENNIDDDAAYSMKARWEKAQEDAAYFKRAAENFSAEAERRQAECEALRKKTLTSDDLTDAQRLIDEAIFDIDGQLKAAAEAIVEHADNPASEEFQQAVKDHRNLTSKLAYYKALNQRVISAMQ